MADIEEIVEMMENLLDGVECESYEVPALTVEHPEGWAIVITKGNIASKLSGMLNEGFKVSAIGKITLH